MTGIWLHMRKSVSFRCEENLIESNEGRGNLYLDEMVWFGMVMLMAEQDKWG